VIISSLGRVNRPRHLGVRTQPLGKILRHRNQPAPGCL
jgi:hypothetical protein